MPVCFDSKKTYIKKLADIVTKDAKSAKLYTEMTAGRCNYVFERRHEIYSLLRLTISKEQYLQHIRLNTLMSIVIKQKKPSNKEYLGTGVVKKFKFDRETDDLIVYL